LIFIEKCKYRCSVFEKKGYDMYFFIEGKMHQIRFDIDAADEKMRIG